MKPIISDPTREIMKMLESYGIEVRGAVPQNVVSSTLSKSEDISAIGRKGWVLRKNLADDEPSTGSASPANVEGQDDLLTEPSRQRTGTWAEEEPRGGT